MSLSLSNVMSSIYDCEENCSLSSDWDGGCHVAIGGSRGKPPCCSSSIHVDEHRFGQNTLTTLGVGQAPQPLSRRLNGMKRIAQFASGSTARSSLANAPPVAEPSARRSVVSCRVFSGEVAALTLSTRATLG
jgi:hypothetical protein